MSAYDPNSGRTGSGIVASRADEYRRRAQQCLEMAQTFRDRDARGSLCYMAEVWLRLADNYQHAKKGRPTMQQQQQIQPRATARKTSPPQLGGFVICSAACARSFLRL